MTPASITYTRVRLKSELEQILALQKRNTKANLSAEEIRKEGFVTVAHSLALLEEMNTASPHIIAKDKDIVVGYALCMHSQFGDRTIESRAFLGTYTLL